MEEKVLSSERHVEGLMANHLKFVRLPPVAFRLAMH